MLIELIGILAFLSNVTGNVMLARKSINGWLVRILSIACWGIYAYHLKSVAIGLNSAAFLGINIYGYKNWSRDKKENS